MQTITPFLWFNDQAEAAADFYVSLFNNSKIGSKTYYNEDIAKVAGKPEGSLMAVDFQLEGQDF
ncbi:MAG TPA: VOC family protein, partial [Bdellovibrio sp.]|nr:VOC family protein [Bdellovibrio sp.]